MYNLEGFTKKANNVINKAYLHAGRLGHVYMGSEHLLLALVTEQGSTSASICHVCGVKEESVLARINMLVGRGEPCIVERDGATPTVRKIIERAILISTENKLHFAGTEHLLLAMLREETCTGSRIINEIGGNVTRITGACSASMGGEHSNACLLYTSPSPRD